MNSKSGKYILFGLGLFALPLIWSGEAQKKPPRFALMPIIMKTEATGFGAGAAGMYFPPQKDTLSHKSHFRFIGIYAAKGQWVLAGSPDVWLFQNKYHLTGDLIYQYWPSDYYEIGNNSGDNFDGILKTSFSNVLGLERGWKETYYLGGELEYTFEKIRYPDSGIVSATLPTGYEGGNIFVQSLIFSYDTRNHAQFPTKGTFFKYKLGLSQNWFVSDFNFLRQYYRLSKYFPTGKLSTFAVGLVGENYFGAPPLSVMPTPNGESVLRGIKNGRYSDKNLFALLSEYRFPIWKIIDGGLFGEMAQVAPKPFDFGWERFHYGVGAGIHLAVVPSERIHIRFDVSYVDDGTRFIIAMLDAF